MTTFTTTKGTPIALADKLAVGGEGAIYTVTGNRDLVAKVYHSAHVDHAAKLKTMRQEHPVSTPGLCWPTDLLLDRARLCVGYTMPRVHSAVPLSIVANPKTRWEVSRNLNWKFLACAAMNLASTIATVHRMGCVVGDISAWNFLVTREALVWSIDCDSMQVPREDGKGYYHCLVATAEYTPAELHGQDLTSTIRTPHHDAFGLAVCVVQLLLGTHPFAGTWRAPGPPPPLPERIRAGYLPNQQGPLLPAPHAAPITILPAGLQQLFHRCFLFGHNNPITRPSAAEWHGALVQLFGSLRSCAHRTNHWFCDHLTSCPWCERSRHGLFDPFEPQPWS